MHGIPFHQFCGARVSQCLCYYDIELFFLLNPEFKANWFSLPMQMWLATHTMCSKPLISLLPGQSLSEWDILYSDMNTCHESTQNWHNFTFFRIWSFPCPPSCMEQTLKNWIGMVGHLKNPLTGKVIVPSSINLLRTFRVYDLNGDGVITKRELGNVLVAVCELMGIDMKPPVS